MYGLLPLSLYPDALRHRLPTCEGATPAHERTPDKGSIRSQKSWEEAGEAFEEGRGTFFPKGSLSPPRFFFDYSAFTTCEGMAGDGGIICTSSCGKAMST